VWDLRTGRQISWITTSQAVGRNNARQRVPIPGAALTGAARQQLSNEPQGGTWVPQTSSVIQTCRKQRRNVRTY
jgi:hypothetical protein